MNYILEQFFFLLIKNFFEEIQSISKEFSIFLILKFHVEIFFIIMYLNL